MRQASCYAEVFPRPGRRRGSLSPGHGGSFRGWGSLAGHVPHVDGVIDELVKHRAQRLVVTTVSRLRRGDVHRGVHPRPMDRVPGVVGELGKEGALDATVALPERVQGVHVGQQGGEAVDEGRSLETPEMTSPSELAEHVLGKGAKVLREAEQV